MHLVMNNLLGDGRKLVFRAHPDTVDVGGAVYPLWDFGRDKRRSSDADRFSSVWQQAVGLFCLWRTAGCAAPFGDVPDDAVVTVQSCRGRLVSVCFRNGVAEAHGLGAPRRLGAIAEPLLGSLLWSRVWAGQLAGTDPALPLMGRHHEDAAARAA